MEDSQEGSEATECQKEDLELPIFDYATIANATDNFSTSNKLGEGGFGPVYKVKNLNKFLCTENTRCYPKRYM